MKKNKFYKIGYRTRFYKEMKCPFYWRMIIVAEAARKMLMKLTTVL